MTFRLAGQVEVVLPQMVTVISRRSVSGRAEPSSTQMSLWLFRIRRSLPRWHGSSSGGSSPWMGSPCLCTGGIPGSPGTGAGLPSQRGGFGLGYGHGRRRRFSA